jgi:hypothetical protein
MTSKQTPPVPRDFLCPITREIMQNPVLLIEDVSLFVKKKYRYII